MYVVSEKKSEKLADRKTTKRDRENNEMNEFD